LFGDFHDPSFAYDSNMQNRQSYQQSYSDRGPRLV
jgi:hypothetical protein